MPKRTDIETILILGSGPIIIGQACEFDYSGTQACQALRDEGFKVVLVNSNPATIMTDPELAHKTYVEPLVPEAVTQVIERERPDALLPTMGGQTSLNLARELHNQGILERYGVELIGAKMEAIERAENREQFQRIVLELGLDVPNGELVESREEALEVARRVGFPLILRPAYTLGGTGGSLCYNVEELRELIDAGLDASPIGQVLVEESIIGWKEFELEVMRDIADNVVIICSIENVDPMGVHTGDSITVAPSQTLTDKQYQRMRDAALRIIRAIGVETGGSNIQFAVSPLDDRMVVIEMNPRVSRSSALASKATGFPIARVAARLAVGYTLDEVQNEITTCTPACFEPTIDYVVVKTPRFDFEKFPGTPDRLGVKMQSVGEAMAFGRTFPEALQKALRSLEQDVSGLETPPEVLERLDGEHKTALKEELRRRLITPSSQSVFLIKWALQAGIPSEEVQELTHWDPWFLHQITRIVEAERHLRLRRPADLQRREWHEAKRLGFSDPQLARILGVGEAEVRRVREAHGVRPTFKVVDTCAAEFAAQTPYLYSTYEQENENVPSDGRKIIILGSGPNRIGQGIEFDYCCVRGVYALQEDGFEVIMVNCNPETVSTDYNTTDKLFFEPLTLENVLDIVEQEQPEGVIVQFGGQTPLKLAIPLEQAGVPILGTSPDKIDLAEDRARFSALLEELELAHPAYGTATSQAEALEVARRIGYPLLVRPSYVLGGRSMQIVYDDDSLINYVIRATRVSWEHPILLDRFLEDAYEFDVDAVSDGEDVYIAAIMQHIEEAGVHSGDSACVLPPYRLSEGQARTIEEATRKLARALKVVGLMNVQYAILEGVVYVLEANPRASRTVPFVSKATGVPLADVAARVMAGRPLNEILEHSPRTKGWVAVKEAVIPFDRFPNTPIYLGPEMRSTGEVMALAPTMGEAFAKVQMNVGALPKEGGVLITVNDNDKLNIVPIARDFQELGLEVYATRGTARALEANGIQVREVFKVNEGRPHAVDLMTNGVISLIVNTPLGKDSRYDEQSIGRQALRLGIPCITTLSGAQAAVRGILAMKTKRLKVYNLQEIHQQVEVKSQG